MTASRTGLTVYGDCPLGHLGSPWSLSSSRSLDLCSDLRETSQESESRSRKDASGLALEATQVISAMYRT